LSRNPLEALSPEVLEDLRHGRATRERKMAVCTAARISRPRIARRFLRFSPETQTKWSPRAQDAILSQPIESFVEALKREQAIPPLFAYAAGILRTSPASATPLVAKQKLSCGISRACCSPPLDAGHPGVDGRTRKGERNLPRWPPLSNTPLRWTVDSKNQLRELYGPGNPIDEAALAEAAAAIEPDLARRQTLIQRLAENDRRAARAIRHKGRPRSRAAP